MFIESSVREQLLPWSLKSKKIEIPGELKNIGHRPRSSIILLPGGQNRAKGMSTYIHSALCYFQK